MTRRGDLKLSHGATTKARENAAKQDRVQPTNASGITRKSLDFYRRTNSTGGTIALRASRHVSDPRWRSERTKTMLDREKDEESARPAPETALDNDGPKGAAEPAYIPTPATPKPPALGLSGMSAIPRRLADIPQGDFWTSAPPAWLDGYLSAAALAPLAPRPGVWLSAVAERDRGMGDGRTLEQFLSLATGRYNELLAGLGEGRFGAAMFAGLGTGIRPRRPGSQRRLAPTRAPGGRPPGAVADRRSRAKSLPMKPHAPFWRSSSMEEPQYGTTPELLPANEE